MNYSLHCNPLQGSTGKYREILEMKTGTLQWKQGSPVMKAGFSLLELTYREFPVSLTGFGFTVYKILSCVFEQTLVCLIFGVFPIDIRHLFGLVTFLSFDELFLLYIHKLRQAPFIVKTTSRRSWLLLEIVQQSVISKSAYYYVPSSSTIYQNWLNLLYLEYFSLKDTSAQLVWADIYSTRNQTLQVWI